MLALAFTLPVATLLIAGAGRNVSAQAARPM